MPTVELRGARKVYPNGVEAVAGVDLSIGEGEYVAIVGPSGSGKSTLLRLVAGLEGMDGGTLFIGGRRADGLAPWARDVAMVFQEPAAYPHLSVAENLAFGLRARGVPARERQGRVAEVAEWLGLADVLRRRPGALSGGQRQRVALGRALARRPAVLLLDEPLSSLDAPLRTAARATLAEAHRRFGATTVHVTHDQAEAMALGDRVAVMDRGRIVGFDTPRALYERPPNRFVAGFIGSPPMNLLPAEVAPDGARLRLLGVERTLPQPLRPGPVVLGVRPEAIAPATAGEPGTLPAVVRSVEPFGHETWATLDLGPAAIIARLGPAADLREGQDLAARLDLAGASWFEPATGDRLEVNAAPRRTA